MENCRCPESVIALFFLRPCLARRPPSRGKPHKHKQPRFQPGAQRQARAAEHEPVVLNRATGAAEGSRGRRPAGSTGAGSWNEVKAVLGRKPRPVRRGKRLLIWADTRNGLAQHDIGHAMAVIEELGYKSGLYDTWIRTDSNIIAKRPKMTTGEPASGGPESKWQRRTQSSSLVIGRLTLDAQGRADLLWFRCMTPARDSFAVHTAANAFMSWPEFGDLIGGRYDEHPWGVTEAPLVVVDPNFPGMKAFGSGGNFQSTSSYQLNNFGGRQDSCCPATGYKSPRYDQE